MYQEVKEEVEQVNAQIFHRSPPQETVALEDMIQGRTMSTSRILTYYAISVAYSATTLEISCF